MNRYTHIHQGNRTRYMPSPRPWEEYLRIESPLDRRRISTLSAELSRQITEKAQTIQNLDILDSVTCKPILRKYGDGGTYVALQFPSDIIEQWLFLIERHQYNTMRIEYESAYQERFSILLYQAIANTQLGVNTTIGANADISTEYTGTLINNKTLTILKQRGYTEESLLNELKSLSFHLEIIGAYIDEKTGWIQLKSRIVTKIGRNSHSASTLNIKGVQIPTQEIYIPLGRVKELAKDIPESRIIPIFTTLRGTPIILTPKNGEKTKAHVNEGHGKVPGAETEPLGFIDPEIITYLEKIFQYSKENPNAPNISSEKYGKVETVSIVREKGNRVSVNLSFSRDIGYTGLHGLMHIWALFPELEEDIKRVVSILDETHNERIELRPQKHDNVTSESAIKVEEIIRRMNEKLQAVDSKFYFKNRSGYPALTLNLSRIGINKENMPDELKTRHIKVAGRSEYGHPNNIRYATAYPMNPRFKPGEPFNFDRVAFNSARAGWKMREIIAIQLEKSVMHWYPELSLLTPVFLELEITE